MKRAVPVVLDALQILALAIWLGGLLAFWVLCVPAWPKAAGASDASLGQVYTRLGGWIEISGLILVGAQFVLRRRYQRDRERFIGDGIRQLLTFGALMVAEYGRYGQPQSSALLLVGSASALLWGLAFAQIGLLIALIALTAWLQTPRSLPAARGKG